MNQQQKQELYTIAENMDELQDFDYVITLGHKITIHEHNGNYFGEFKDIDQAIQYIYWKISNSGYYPNVFIQNDHGNIDQIILKIIVF